MDKRAFQFTTRGHCISAFLNNIQHHKVNLKGRLINDIPTSSSAELYQLLCYLNRAAINLI